MYKCCFYKLDHDLQFIYISILNSDLSVLIDLLAVTFAYKFIFLFMLQSL